MCVRVSHTLSRSLARARARSLSHTYSLSLPPPLSLSLSLAHTAHGTSQPMPTAKVTPVIRHEITPVIRPQGTPVIRPDTQASAPCVRSSPPAKNPAAAQPHQAVGEGRGQDSRECGVVADKTKDEVEFAWDYAAGCRDRCVCR